MTGPQFLWLLCAMFWLTAEVVSTKMKMKQGHYLKGFALIFGIAAMIWFFIELKF